MQQIQSKFEQLCKTPSDINKHLPMLKSYASQCKHVTEFGVRGVVSTWAFLEARPETYRGYDIHYNKNMDEAAMFAAKNNINASFIIESTLTATIEKTDFIFFDTLHTYEQLEAELYRHHESARKYMGFHDMVSFAYVDEDPKSKTGKKLTPGNPEHSGLLPAVFQFLSDNPSWRVDYFSADNNGLLILKKGA